MEEVIVCKMSIIRNFEEYGYVKTISHYSLLLYVIDCLVNTTLVLFYNLGTFKSRMSPNIYLRKNSIQILSQLPTGSIISGQEACAEPECHAQLWHGLSCVFILR